MINFQKFTEIFSDEQTCLEHLMQEHYGGTKLDCPKCEEHRKFYRMTKERGYVCGNCGHHLHPCAGTIMRRSRTPLTKWFFAMYLFANSRNGVSALELQRHIGVTYKCAWRMAHQIRKHMGSIDKTLPLKGEVEADETYIGGRTYHGPRGRGAHNKTIVFAMAERGGSIVSKVIENVRKHTLQPIICDTVKEGSTINTDELKSYVGLNKEGYIHRRVNHSMGQYVDGTCHVNSVEGFWARLKLSIRGTHVHVSRRHMQNYVSEFAYRYNRRHEPERIFSDMVSSLHSSPT